MTIEEVKQELPSVRIIWLGRMWSASIRGRQNKFATVVLQDTLAAAFTFTWEAIARAITTKTPLTGD